MRVSPVHANLKIRENEDVTTVRLIACQLLDRLEIQELRSALLAFAATHENTLVILDLTVVKHFASEMLGTLVELKKALEANGSQLEIRNVTPDVFEVFRITALDRELNAFKAV